VPETSRIDPYYAVEDMMKMGKDAGWGFFLELDLALSVVNN